MRLFTVFALMAAFGFSVFADDVKKEEKKKPAEEKPAEEKPAEEKTEPEAKAPTYPKAPAFKAKGIDGKEYSLEQFKGKVVVLEWHDFNCPWVKRHYKQGVMQALQKKYTAKEKGVVWLAVCSTRAKHVAYLKPEEIEAQRVTYKSTPTAMLMDTNGVIGQAYKAKTTPHMYVINKKGEVVYNGAIDNLRDTRNKDELKSNTSYVSEVLDAVLAGKTPKVKNNQPYG